MILQGKTIGFAVTGSHCTLDEVMPEIQRLADEGATIIPILSPAVAETDTRFGSAREWTARLRSMTMKEPIKSIAEAEPIGPGSMLDALVIAPCTGNTLAKLATGITDSPVLMAAKAQMRNHRPLVLAVSTNDGLGINARNIGFLLNMKNIYLVPFGQDDPYKKENSLKAHMAMIMATLLAAMEGKQIQPVLKSYSM